ncbi:MAG TPA: hypothetical protein P5280_14520 [Cyclobacteriaceae bacterium]|nr:hypothetical protein [Cyclobacteriaceae bacterium]
MSDLKQKYKEIQKKHYSRLLNLLGIAILFSVGLAIFQGVSAPTVIAGVFGSLVASAIFFFLHTVFVEETAITYLAASASEAAVSYTLERLSYVPTKTYPDSGTPDPGFEQDHLTSLNNSSFFWFKGISANFAAQRLQSLRGTGFLRNKQFRVLMLNPDRRDLLEAYARMRLTNQGTAFDSTDVGNLADKKTSEIVNSLITLQKVGQQCEMEVRFHNDFVFSRSEIFSDGIYLSYYDGGRPFPGSLYYSCRSKEGGAPSSVYTGYLGDFSHHFHTGIEALKINATEDDLEATLNHYGYNSQGNRLR